MHCTVATSHGCSSVQHDCPLQPNTRTPGGCRVIRLGRGAARGAATRCRFFEGSAGFAWLYEVP